MTHSRVLPVFLVLFTVDAATVFCDDTGWENRSHLLGDLGGARTALAERGVEVDFVVTGEYLYNFDGGEDVGGDFRWDTSLYLRLVTDDAGWWANGEFFVHLQAQGGNGISEDHVGDFQVLSNIDADDFQQVSEFWYRHWFADERVWLKLGKMEANEDFAFVEFGGEFINSSPGFSPTIPLVTYPDQDLGAVVGATLTPWLSVNFGVYQGTNDGSRSIGNTIDSLDGPKVMLEPSFHYHIADNPGTLRFGAWWNGENLTSLNGLTTTDQTWGVYATMDQLVYRENPSVEDDEQGIGVFAQLGFSSDDYYEAESYYGAGFQWHGPIPTRDADVAGVGVFHVELSDEGDFSEDSETAIELFYRLQITPWFSVKPDIQYIVDPGGSTNDDAIVGGFRTEVWF